MSNFVKNCSNLLQKTVSGVGAFSLVLGSFLSLTQAPLPVKAAFLNGDLNRATVGEILSLDVEYTATDFSAAPITGSVSFPEIRIQIDNNTLEFVDFSATEQPCFDSANNQVFANRECAREFVEGTYSPAITNSQSILKTGAGPNSGTLAGTANNTTVLSFCPLSSIPSSLQYNPGGSTVSGSNASDSPSGVSESCDSANIPQNQTGNLIFKVRVKDAAVDWDNAIRAIIRTNSGQSAQVNGYDFNGWSNVSIHEMDLNIFTGSNRPLVISEVNWAGSSTSALDQWIELYNTTDEAISLEGVTIDDLTLNAATCGASPIIAAKSYFLISKLAHTDPLSLLNVQSDCVNSGLSLSTTGEQLSLQLGNQIFDRTTEGAWPSGSNAGGACNGSSASVSNMCVSMQRETWTFPAIGSDASLWRVSKAALNEDTNLQNPGANIVIGQKTPKAPSENITANGGGFYEAEMMKINAGSVVDNSTEGLNVAGSSIKSTAGTSNYIAYGPYTLELVPGAFYKASFRMAVSDNTNPNLALGIDVFSTRGPINHMQIKPSQFTANKTFQDFDLIFMAPSTRVEFRLSSNSQSPDVYFDKVVLSPSEAVAQVYEAENMLRPAANTVLACNNTCVQNGPNLQDWLLFGPYTRADRAGNRTANFKMKIDNNTTGNEAVIIAVRNATTGVYQTARKVYPQEFTANDTFQDFGLAFNKSNPDHVYEYVAYYDRNWGGRTVSIDKITVQ